MASSAQTVDSSFGRIEICVNATWGTICSDFWENMDASVICKQLGYSEYGLFSSSHAYNMHGCAIIVCMLTAVVVCTICYVGAVAGQGLYTDTIWPFHIIDLNCTGVERTIWECPHNGLFDDYSCSSRNDASVRCQGLLIIFHFWFKYSMRCIKLYYYVHCSNACCLC